MTEASVSLTSKEGRTSVLIEATTISTRGELEKLAATLKEWSRLLPEKLPRAARVKLKPVAKAKSTAVKRVLPSRKVAASNAPEATPPTAA